MIAYVENLGATNLNKHYAKLLGYTRDQQLMHISVAIFKAGLKQIADLLTKATTNAIFDLPQATRTPAGGMPIAACYSVQIEPCGRLLLRAGDPTLFFIHTVNIEAHLSISRF